MLKTTITEPCAVHHWLQPYRDLLPTAVRVSTRTTNVSSVTMAILGDGIFKLNIAPHNLTIAVTGRGAMAGLDPYPDATLDDMPLAVLEEFLQPYQQPAAGRPKGIPRERLELFMRLWYWDKAGMDVCLAKTGLSRSYGYQFIGGHYRPDIPVIHLPPSYTKLGDSAWRVVNDQRALRDLVKRYTHDLDVHEFMNVWNNAYRATLHGYAADPDSVGFENEDGDLIAVGTKCNSASP